MASAELGLAMQKLGSQVVELHVERELRGAKLFLDRALFDVVRRDLLHAGKRLDLQACVLVFVLLLSRPACAS